MTHRDDITDTERLEALRGERDKPLSKEEANEADAIRVAFQRRAKWLDKAAPDPSQEALQRIQFAVRQKKANQSRWKWASPRVLALAASIGVFAALVIQIVPRYVDDARQSTEGLSRFAFIIPSDDPKATASSILEQLGSRNASWVHRGGNGEPAGIEPLIDDSSGDSAQDLKPRELENGRVVLRIPATEDNLEVLRALNLGAIPHEGVIELVIVPNIPE